MTENFKDIRIQPHKAEIGGQAYLLEFDFAAYALLEELSGLSVFKLKDMILENSVTIKNMLILFYCALLKHHPNFDIETLKNADRVGSVLQENLNAIYSAFFEPLLPANIASQIEME